METSSSKSINTPSTWAGNSRNQQAAATDPMAFFDLIMKTSQSLSGKGNNTFDPTAAGQGSSGIHDDPYTAVTDNPSLHDDHYDDASSAASADALRSEPSEANVPGDEDAGAEDVAAVTDFSKNGSTEEDSSEDPDQAALETAAAAGQQDQILGAPDTLATTEEDQQVVAAAQDNGAEAGPQKTSQANAGNIDTDQPLDTSITAQQAEDGEGEQLAAEVDAAAKKSADSQEEETIDPAEQALAEASATDEVAADTETVSSQQETGQEELSAEQVEEANTPELETTSGEEASGHDSAHDGEARSAQRRSDRPDPKPEAVDTKAEAPVEATTSVAASSEAGEAAAAAGAVAATNGTSAATSGSSTSNGSGVQNIASLLQRGMQRGTLQKTTEGKPSTQLDSRQQIRLINRVARAVESTPPGQSIKIRLNPSELGQLKVEIKIESGNMTAKIEAENSATRQVLLDNLPQLRERLAEANINVQQFDVELMGQQSSYDGAASNMADQSSDQGGQRSSQGSALGSSQEEDTTPRSTEVVNKEAERDSRNLNITV